MEEYKRVEHTVTLIHYSLDEGIGKEETEQALTETKTKRLRTWFDQMLRIEDCPPARDMLRVLTAAVHGQAVEAGYADAMEHGESKLSAFAQPLWSSGYTQGFATGMTDRYDDHYSATEGGGN